MFDTGKSLLHLRQKQLAAVAVGYIRGQRLDLKEQALRVNEQVALAPLDLLAAVVTSQPPFSLVLTDCESKMAALGWALRPAFTRAFSRRAF